MPSALDVAVRALETRLQAAFPTTPIAWPNVEFTAQPGTAYLQPWVLWGAGQLFTMGPSHANRVVGVYQVNVWVPMARGAGLSMDMSDLVRTTFNRVEVSGVRCDAPSGPAPLEEEPPWYGVAVSIPFSVEETTP